MKRKWILLLGGWLMVVVVLGCGQTAPPTTPSDEAAAATIAPIDTPEAQPSPTVGAPAPLWTVAPISPTQVIQEEAVTVNPTISTPSNPALQNLVMQAKEDLARRLSIEMEQIGLIELEAVEWPDASLGCPQLGMMYAQVITPGFRVVLEVEEQAYEYHTDKSQSAVFCKEESMTDTPTNPGLIEPGLDSLISLAKEDLAQRLSIQVEQIEVLETKSVVWPDASLGCPMPGMRYRQVPQDGLLIRLAVEGRGYAYHSGGGRDPFLCEQVTKAAKGTPQSLELVPPPRSEDK